jgi:N-acyl-D-amino-acid deacylase
MHTFRYFAVGLLPALLAAQATPSNTHAQTYDVIIRNGRVIDGTGNPWFVADLALDGDRIAAIGDLGAATAGLYVTPGFIDAHSHAGPGLATAGLSHGEPLLAQGVTTVVINPDGGGPADLARQRSELLRDGLGLGIKFEVQQARGSLFCFITLLRGSEAESFTRSVVEFVGDTRAVGLGDVSHALTFG